MKYISSFEKQHSLPAQIFMSASLMTLISFMNIGVIIVLVSINIGHYLPVPILQGSYANFSVKWYQYVGSYLCIQMVLLVISQPIFNILYEFYFSCIRCCDRGCRSSSRNTKQVTQADYEDINTYNEFEWDYRYCVNLTVMFVAMLYGSGMPILYLIAAIFYGAQYWVDKYLIFYYHRKPEMLDQYLAKNTVMLYKYAALLHFIGGTLMITNSAILPSADSGKVQFAVKVRGYVKRYSHGLIQSINSSVYVAILAAIIVCFILWRLFFLNILTLFNRVCKRVKAKYLENENLQGDFYTCVNLNTLRQLLVEQERDLKLYTEILEKGQKHRSSLSTSDIEELVS